MKIRILTANYYDDKPTHWGIEGRIRDTLDMARITLVRSSQFLPVLTPSSSTSGSPMLSSPPMPSKLVHLPFFEWENVTVVYNFHPCCSLHLPAPHPNACFFHFISPLQPHDFHNEATTSVFNNRECSGKVHFAGLAPHRCQTAINIAWPVFWCSSCRL